MTTGSIIGRAWDGEFRQACCNRHHSFAIVRCFDVCPSDMKGLLLLLLVSRKSATQQSRRANNWHQQVPVVGGEREQWWWLQMIG